MPDTVNTPEVLCWPVNLADATETCFNQLAWTDRCLASHWVRVWSEQTQPIWTELEGEGFLVKSEHFGSTGGQWRFINVGLPYTREHTLTIIPLFVGDQHSGVTIEMRLLRFNPLDPIDTREELWSGSWAPRSKAGEKKLFACDPVVGIGCVAIGPVEIEWWPSCDGTPKEGPTVPMFVF